MADDKKVVTKGGGDNLYKVSESYGKYYVYKINVGIIFNDYTNIGETSSFEDALALIKAYSGKEIEKISNW